MTRAIVIGAGPAGLAVAACLKRVGISCVVLEQASEVGATWHRHYDRLHLHTPKGQSALPFLPFPSDYPRYPSREQMVNYLEAYARQFQLEIRLGEAVRSVRLTEDRWQVESEKATYSVANVVIASGLARDPNLPEYAGLASYRGAVLHSSQYRNGEPFRNKSVLVIGFGNSGGEIAIDLHEHGARPGLSVRGPVNVVPRELFGIPVTGVSVMQRVLPSRIVDAINAPILRAVMGDLERIGLRKFPMGPVTRIRREARVPIIDVGTIALIRRGHIEVFPGINGFTKSGVVFTDGTERTFDAVIFATGFRPRVDAFLKSEVAVCDEDGRPFASGTSTGIPGLYFCGYRVAPTGMLREIGIEAQRISTEITRKTSFDRPR